MPNKRPFTTHPVRLGLYLSLILVLLVACVFVGIVYHYAHRSPSTRHADAAIVLGAAAWGVNPSPVFRERINHAIDLYKNDQVDKLIFTGGTPKPGFMTEAEVGRRYALNNGVNKSDILLETTSRDTYHNLLYARYEAQANQLHSFIIVSDPYHLARAAYIARDLNMDAETSATPTTRYQQAGPRITFLLQESYLLFMYQWGKFIEWLGDQALPRPLSASNHL